jgi:hypothetical protein
MNIEQFCLLFPNYPLKNVLNENHFSVNINRFLQYSDLNQRQLVQKYFLLLQSPDPIKIKQEESSFWMKFSKCINNRLYKMTNQSQPSSIQTFHLSSLDLKIFHIIFLHLILILVLKLVVQYFHV